MWSQGWEPLPYTEPLLSLVLLHLFTICDPILNDEFSEDRVDFLLDFVPAALSTIPGVGKVYKNWTGDKNSPLQF